MSASLKVIEVTPGRFVVKGQPSPEPAPTPAPIDAASLMQKQFAPMRWTVPGLLPEGCVLLVGKPKSGKSWLALAIGAGVAHGGYVLGSVPVEPGDVLYLALEDNERRLQKRLGVLLGEDQAPERLHLLTESPRAGVGGLDIIRDWVKDHPGARLVIIDTLAKFRDIPSGRDNAYQADYLAVGNLQRLSAELRITILIVHHDNKGDHLDVVDSISGTTGLAGAADGWLILKRTRGSNDAVLHVDGRDIEDNDPLSLQWDQSRARWLLNGKADLSPMTDERKEVMGVLTAATEAMSPKEVADELGKPRDTVQRLLRRLHDAGKLSREGTEAGGYKYRLSIPPYPNHPKCPNLPSLPNCPNPDENEVRNSLGIPPYPNVAPTLARFRGALGTLGTLGEANSDPCPDGWERGVI